MEDKENPGLNPDQPEDSPSSPAFATHTDGNEETDITPNRALRGAEQPRAGHFEIQGAIDLTPDGHPKKPVFPILGYSLRSRFKRVGEQSDLEEAILTQECCQVHPRCTGGSSHLNSLGLREERAAFTDLTAIIFRSPLHFSRANLRIVRNVTKTMISRASVVADLLNTKMSMRPCVSAAITHTSFRLFCPRIWRSSDRLAHLSESPRLTHRRRTNASVSPAGTRNEPGGGACCCRGQLQIVDPRDERVQVKSVPGMHNTAETEVRDVS